MKYQIILLASAALVSTAAMAGDNEKQSKSETSAFEMLDKDADGKLTQEEVSGNETLSASFTRLDGDNDGVISKREFQRNTRRKPDRTVGY
jgi:Ca2+-binding EF-hand superfamily protein